MASTDPPATQADIARLAHDIWEAEGRPEGRHLDHWRRAEAILAGPGARRPSVAREQPPAGRPEGAPYSEAPEMPGLRNPEPIPPTNEQGYATVPSDDDSAPATLGDAPEPAADARKPARRRQKPES